MSHIKTPISEYFPTQDDYKKYGEPTEKEEDNRRSVAIAAQLNWFFVVAFKFCI